MSEPRSAGVGRYWRTIRHLRPVQIYGRARLALPMPGIDRAPAPPRRPSDGTFIAPVQRAPCMTGADAFFLLNREGRLAGAAPWNVAGRDRLWHYHLHYFDDLTTADAPARADWHRRLIARWIAENPPGAGTGWEPYPVSLRIVNWIKWALAGNRLDAEWLDSLAIQTRWLSRRVEWHLLGNHLIANAKALVFAGVFFGGAEAAQWLGAGLAILRAQIPEQVLGDGGHFELSPMYHAIVLADLIDLLNLAAAYPGVIPPQDEVLWCDTSARMRRWLAVMSHPDGEISFFNDAALGIAPAPADIEAYAARLGLAPVAPEAARVIHLADSGYVRLSDGDCTLLLDVGAVGPSYLPGHAHADTLSFELSVGRDRVIVNSGTSHYGSGAERQAERGTAAHSTVEIDGENSSEVWAGFRTGRRARVHDLVIRESDDAVTVSCSHDGYRWLAGKPVHRRQWTLRAGSLQVDDFVSSAAGRQPIAYYHLAPDVGGAGLDGEPRHDGTLTTPAGARIGWRSSLPMAAMTRQHHAAFGASQPAATLCARFPGHALSMAWSWQDTGRQPARSASASGAETRSDDGKANARKTITRPHAHSLPHG